MSPRRASIRSYLALLTLVAVLPALALIVHGGLRQRDEAIAQAQNQLRILAGSLVESQLGTIKAARQTLQTLALTPAVQQQNATNCSRLFQAVVKQTPALLNIALCDKGGRVLAAARPLETRYLADRKHVRDALRLNRFAAGEFLFTRLGRTEPAFAYALPLRDSQGQTRGVLTAVLRLSDFASLLQQARLPDASFMAVTDHQGTRLFFHPANPANPIGRPIAPTTWQAAGQAQEAGQVSVIASNGRRTLMAYHPVRLTSDEAPHLVIWVGIAEQRILAQANRQWQYGLSLMVLVTLLALLSARQLGLKLLVKPLALLAQAAEEFGHGRPWRLPRTRRQPLELERLADSFEHMVLHLQQSQQQQQQSEERLRHLATHDELTGLANRRLLHERLEQAISTQAQRQQRVAVLLLDLDRFQFINDSLGHNQGDALLCQIGARLRQCVQPEDTVCRLGGDEFALVLNDPGPGDSLTSLAGQLLHRISQPCIIGNHHVTVTASLGISLFPADGGDSISLLRNADLAMYQAKQRGNGFAFYHAEMNRHALKILELENDLRHALERRELLLHYQPKVELARGRIIGCEALLRWQHPQRGLVSPAEFIPLAEETGLIVPIGAWALLEACNQAMQWQQQGLPAIGMAVNLSSRQFRSGDLPAAVATALRHSSLPASRLELELTESMVMDDPAGAVQTMQQLKGCGLQLSLDDFGTGYSSLNYLRHFPVDCLKIDASFIRDVDHDPSAAAVVTSIIDIAQNLGLTTIAEGVETPAQLTFLRRCQCDALQGYLFSRPLPAADFAQLLARPPALAHLASGA